MIHLTHSFKSQTPLEQEMKNDFIFLYIFSLFSIFCSLLSLVHQHVTKTDGPFRDSKMTLKIIEPVFFSSKTGSKILAYRRRVWKRSCQYKQSVASWPLTGWTLHHRELGFRVYRTAPQGKKNVKSPFRIDIKQLTQTSKTYYAVNKRILMHFDQLFSWVSLLEDYTFFHNCGS